MHSIHVPIKILNLGDSTSAGVLPLILPQRKRLPQIAHWKGTDINKAALKCTGSWGSWGSEVPKSSPTPHLPDELDPLLDSLTPLVTCSKVGTFGKDQWTNKVWYPRLK